ncbi:MAG: efflux RND transporter permease subunit, partial [FCB group bacterium]|nr:efflux RND transporter permease subunit [FCB group bacterium]
MQHQKPTLLDKILRYCLNNQILVLMGLVAVIFWGILVAPFDWKIPGIDRSPIPVDAIPDIGENQQIVFTKWMGRSPQDVEDQITYPLTVALLGVPEIRTIRSYSMFGFSTIYVIFKEDAEFYWSRSRILEKLNSLPSGTLPADAQPTLGPDATALGQVFWYTLEGRDEDGNPAGGWDLQELRSIQDWYVRYGLQSADGVAEVASIGGFQKEYQIDVDPTAMQQKGVTLNQIFMAVKNSNVDVGARTIEINRVEYVVRGVGFIKSLADIENTAVKVVDNVPVYIRDIANVSLGPALRRGVLDKGGAEAVGGVVVARFGENPLSVISHVKDKIAELSPGLPSRELADGRISQITIVPFYDRTGLIYETLGTLNHALRDEILITLIVVIMMVMHFRASLLVGGLLPLTVLMVFIGMTLTGVDANIVSLSGIAIAIGTIVDMGIVVSENMLRHLSLADEKESRLEILYRATSEVGGAVVTAVSTTVVSFLPVFAMQGAEGKLFRPLAYTKTFALVASVLVALTILPVLAHLIFRDKNSVGRISRFVRILLIITGFVVMFTLKWWLGLLICLVAGYPMLRDWVNLSRWIEKIPGLSLFRKFGVKPRYLWNWIVILIVTLILAATWAPLGVGRAYLVNFLFVVLILGSVMGALLLFVKYYPKMLRWFLDHKFSALSGPAILVVFGFIVWLGFGTVTGFLPDLLKKNTVYSYFDHAFPGLGKEFMPPLDEGSYLYMPTTMPHAGTEETIDVLQKLDMALYSVPEVDLVVGKIGRAETPLDPAPLSMVETIVSYKPEFKTDREGNRLKFRVDSSGVFVLDENGDPVPDPDGKPFRQWRDHILTPDHIWDELVKAAQIPGTTSAPKLQPISTRLVMLQSGMRAPMCIKVKGPDLETIEQVGLELEALIKNVPGVKPAAVLADRIVGKPYLEIEIDRLSIARYGMSVRQVQDVIEVAIGGKPITASVEGRERYLIRVRYMRELRDNLEALEDILVPAPDGTQIPLGQLAVINYVRGPQVIKSEDTFLLGYVLFDKEDLYAEVDVVENVQKYLASKINSGELVIPAGVSYAFAGSYENQIRATKKLRLILPLALFFIFMILYLQFKRVSTTLIVFSGIFVAWSGGFTMIWLYGQDWFMNFSLFSMNMRDLFQMHPVNLSVAVWVGFLAL